jgi:hypothetical protein
MFAPAYMGRRRRAQPYDRFCHSSLGKKGKPQISPLRYAPLEMTILFKLRFRIFPGNAEFFLKQICHLERSVA